MNKVVNIEIAGQVFWIDEAAYGILQDYLHKIRRQLVDDECADDIYADIELRIAELLYALSNGQKAIVSAQLEQVIAQVGYIEGEDSEADSGADYPRKSFLDPQNKILAGVCAGLATKLRVPAFILRLIFVVLIGAFGLGILLYLIFWLALDVNSNRNAGLAAQGKARTARQIAHFEAPREPRLTQIQRIIFLPVSVLGTLATAIGGHFNARRSRYLVVAKNLIAVALLASALFLCAGIFEFNDSRYFHWPLAWLFSASALYLIVLGLAIFLREFYLAKPNFKINKMLKWGALIPIGLITSSGVFLNHAHRQHHHEAVEKAFGLADGRLALVLNKERPSRGYAEPVRIQIRTHPDANRKLVLHLNYASDGVDIERAKDNLREIDYYYTFEGHTLTLNRSWSLREGALQRGQDLEVIVEIPQDTLVSASGALKVNRESRPYHYVILDQPREMHAYIADGSYLFDHSEDTSHKISRNERDILEDRFCEEFFISESWRCSFNIETPVAQNSRFDRAFANHSETIDQIRQYLLPNRSILVSNLVEINELTAGLSMDNPVMSKFRAYLEELIIVKADIGLDRDPEPQPNPPVRAVPERQKI